MNLQDARGYTALHYIAETAHLFDNALLIAALLLKHFADVNITNYYGKTPLDIAKERASSGSFHSLQELTRREDFVRLLQIGKDRSDSLIFS